MGEPWMTKKEMSIAKRKFMADEYQKCKDDIIYFVEKYCVDSNHEPIFLTEEDKVFLKIYSNLQQ